MYRIFYKVELCYIIAMNKEQLLVYLSREGFDQKIVSAFERVAREDFLDKSLVSQAYQNIALPLQSGATISQPYTIAFMLDLLELKAGQKILEIGSGCGYVLALLNQLVPEAQLYGLEIIESLAKKSQKLLDDFSNIKIITASGSKGYAPAAPYDRILISAAAGKMPTQIYSQLKEGGILVCPVANSIWQIKKIREKIISREFPGFVFVPLKD